MHKIMGKCDRKAERQRKNFEIDFIFKPMINKPMHQETKALHNHRKIRLKQKRKLLQ